MDPEGIQKVLTAASSNETTLVKVNLKLTHPFPSDLIVNLVSPQGRSYQVLENSTTQAGTSEVAVAIPVMKEPIAGAWLLKVVDTKQGDTGTLDSWSLRVNAIAGSERTAPTASCAARKPFAPKY
jgi:serine protease